MRRYSLRLVALGYLVAILAGPLAIVFWRTFQHGLTPAWDALSSHDTIHAYGRQGWFGPWFRPREEAV